jgi:hypothetical protein
MTMDMAILIDLHYVEVVHFTHIIRILIVWASSPHKILCHDKHPTKTFRQPTLAWEPPYECYTPRHRVSPPIHSFISKQNPTPHRHIRSSHSNRPVSRDYRALPITQGNPASWDFSPPIGV